jgi:uncharacterized protein
MAEYTIPQHGTVCWRELHTKDLNKAMDFYKNLLGWHLEQSKVSPDMGYMEIHLDNRAVGGMMELNENWGEGWEQIPSSWNTYIAVDNCDETVAQITANGGQICMPPFDAPGVGRMATASDPGGAVFSVIQFEMPR